VAIRAAILSGLDADLRAVGEAIALQLERLDEDATRFDADMRAESERFDRYMNDLEARRAAALAKVDATMAAQRAWIAKWSSDGRAAMRNALRSKMRTGIVDGPRLTRAMADEQSVAIDEAVEPLQEAVLVLHDELRERLGGMAEWRARKPEIRHAVVRPEAVKLENLGQPVLAGGGVLAGGWAGGVAGAEAGAMIGVLFGPAGMAVGGAIGGAIGMIVGGILGGLGGEWLGKKAKKGATELRAQAAEKEVFAAIDRFFEEASASLRAQLDPLRGDLVRNLDEWTRRQRDRFEAEASGARAARASSAEERAARKTALGRDGDAARRLLDRLGEVAK
jgi:hypothetical protein